MLRRCCLWPLHGLCKDGWECHALLSTRQNRLWSFLASRVNQDTASLRLWIRLITKTRSISGEGRSERARHHRFQLKQLLVNALQLIRCANLRHRVHHTLSQVNQALFWCDLPDIFLVLLFLYVYHLGLELRVDILKHRDLSLWVSPADCGTSRWLRWLVRLRLLTHPSLGALLHLHRYNALHGLLHIILIQVRGDLGWSEFLNYLVLLAQLLSLQLYHVLQFCSLVVVPGRSCLARRRCWILLVVELRFSWDPCGRRFNSWGVFITEVIGVERVTIIIVIQTPIVLQMLHATTANEVFIVVIVQLLGHFVVRQVIIYIGELCLRNLNLSGAHDWFKLLDSVLVTLIIHTEPFAATVKLRQLLLHRYDCLVSFIKPWRQPNHYISLFEK